MDKPTDFTGHITEMGLSQWNASVFDSPIIDKIMF